MKTLRVVLSCSLPASRKRISRLAASCLLIAGIASGMAAGAASNSAASKPAWNPRLAARYLDYREVWWQAWPHAQRDHQTVCISCHTVLPYALARPVLTGELRESGPAAPERVMFDDIARRVTLWNEVQPFYKNGNAGPTKSIESRDTEAVLNALILASYDARRDHLTELTKSAFQDAWALQQRTGPKAGAWIWLNFHNGPWESNISEYWGATMAALAAGIAPDRYLSDPAIQPNLRLLRAYLRKNYDTQPLVNKIAVLWIAPKFPGLLTTAQRSALVKSVLALQQNDGGWTASTLADWKRRDNTPLVTASDGYATGLIVLALEQNGMSLLPAVARGRKWLLRNQNPVDGNWTAWSLNRKHDPGSETGRFMSDAATGYAVLALANQN